MNDATTIKAMANKLVSERVDLGDERAVLRSLNRPLADATRFTHTAADVMALYERAIDAARGMIAEQSVPQ